MLNGQKLQGPLAALEVHKLLKASNNEKKLVTVDKVIVMHSFYY